MECHGSVDSAQSEPMCFVHQRGASPELQNEGQHNSVRVKGRGPQRCESGGPWTWCQGSAGTRQENGSTSSVDRSISAAAQRPLTTRHQARPTQRRKLREHSEEAHGSVITPSFGGDARKPRRELAGNNAEKLRPG